MQQDVKTLYNITHSLYSSLSYQQIVLHICSILANLRDSLYYMREVAIHSMDYADPATTGILSPQVQPVEDLTEMLLHIETLPSTMHIPISSEDALHFYRYLCIHVLIADEQFLLLIDVSMQDCAQQLAIYEVFNLAIPHGNFSAHYSINNRYLRIMHDETKAVEISEDQFKTCQKANGQFCCWTHPFYHLQTHQCVYQLYMPKTRLASRKDVHYKSGKPVVWAYQHPLLQMSGYNFTNHSSAIRNHTHLRWSSTQIHHTTNIHTHTSITTSMQCYILLFSPTTMLWNPWTYCQHITEHSQSQCYKHLIPGIQIMAESKGSLEWNSTPSLGQYTISIHWYALQTNGQQ